MSNPWLEPTAWDYVVLSGRRSPGIAKIEGFSRKVEWQVMAPPGTFGGALWLKQVPPSKGSIVCTLFSEEHYAEWAAWVSDAIGSFPRDQSGGLKGRPKIKPASIYHPSLRPLGVTQVLFESLDPLRLGSSPGQYIGKINFVEYLPPVKANAKAQGPIPNVDVERKRPQPTARTEQDVRLAETLARAQKV